MKYGFTFIRGIAISRPPGDIDSPSSTGSAVSLSGRGWRALELSTAVGTVVYFGISELPGETAAGGLS